MTGFPFTINDFTVCRISPGDGTEQGLYCLQQSATSVKIYNIPTFFNRNSLTNFLNMFGKLHKFLYDKNSNSALVTFDRKKSASALLSTPMTVAYGIRLPTVKFSQIIVDATRSWLKDSTSLKKQSEDYLQAYFQEKLADGFSSEDDQDDWVMTKPKKRRLK